MSAFIDERRARFGVEPICETLDPSASAYYHRAPGTRSDRAFEDERLWRTTTPDPAARRPPDLVDRDFTAERPDELLLPCYEEPVGRSERAGEACGSRRR